MRPDNRTPTLSVCLPTYNRARYLRESLPSVLNQTYEDFELIIGDNCSTDQTEQIVREYARTDNRIIYLRHDANIGAMKNGFALLNAARSKYIACFHDDDVMMPGHLASSVKVLEENPGVGFAHCGAIEIDSEGKPTGLIRNGGLAADAVLPGNDYLVRLLSGFNPICAPSVVVRRSCLDLAGSPDERLPCTNDYELWMRFCLFGDVAFLAGPHLKYRVHSGNDTNNYFGNVGFFEQMYLARRVVLEKYPDRIPNAKLLLRWVTRRSSREALCEAYNLAAAGRYADAKEYVDFALRIDPASCISPVMLRTQLRRFVRETAINRAKKLLKGFGLAS
ncbi:MAG: glycosyltransferase [Isosphaeraceae bacterium]|nr:glycosyltransferase [Isosphaeraceae bacterium]